MVAVVVVVVVVVVVPMMLMVVVVVVFMLVAVFVWGGRSKKKIFKKYKYIIDFIPYYPCMDGHLMPKNEIMGFMEGSRGPMIMKIFSVIELLLYT